jgi:hypothetical protein
MKHTAERQFPFGDAGPQDERVPSSRPREELLVDWTDDPRAPDTERFIDWTDEASQTGMGMRVDEDEDDAPDTDRSGVFPRLELPWQPESDPAALGLDAEPRWQDDVWEGEPRPSAPPGWPITQAAPREPVYDEPLRDEDDASRPTWPTGHPIADIEEVPTDAARPLATYVSEELEPTPGGELPADLFGYPSAEEEPVTWLFDPEVERVWDARRPRRIAVRTLGWMLVALSIVGLVRLAATDAVAAEMGYFASMGQVDGDSLAGSVVRAKVRMAHALSERALDAD